MDRKASGRLRAYAARSGARPARRATKFKCRNCGQKVWVDAALARTAITCPSCEHQVPAPQPRRILLEICGGIILFLSGVALGHAPFARTYLPIRAPASIIQDHGKKKPVTKQDAPKPRWFADQSDDEP
jgi:DNA-directed RNA polymerase subunit RPC12/RpoP